MKIRLGKITKDKMDDGTPCLLVKQTLLAFLLNKPVIVYGDSLNMKS